MLFLPFLVVSAMMLAGVVYWIIVSSKQALVQQREQARAEKNWQRADGLRQELIKLGYRVEDFGTIQNVFQSVAVKETK